MLCFFTDGDLGGFTQTIKYKFILQFNNAEFQLSLEQSQSIAQESFIYRNKSMEKLIEFQLSPEQAQRIAQEAYIYSYPMLENYETMYVFAVDNDPGNDQFKAGFNKLSNERKLLTSEDTAVIAPNRDTLFSYLWMDLRNEPLVLSVPEIVDDRYYSIQLIDLFTNNFNYIGTRATGIESGNYLIAGPNWEGKKPEGIDKVFVSETDLAYALYRTEVFNEEDIETGVKEIQNQYQVQTLSKFLSQPSPEPPTEINFPKIEPGLATAIDSGIDFINYVNFLLEFAEFHPSEQKLAEEFSKIGIKPGQQIKPEDISPEILAAIEAGIEDGKEQIANQIPQIAPLNRNWLPSTNLYGSRDFWLQFPEEERFLQRAAGASVGLYGNSVKETVYFGGFSDAFGNPLDASQNDYLLEFPTEPPVNSFWSLTIYDAQTQLFIDNPIDRYGINSNEVRDGIIEKNDNGSIQIYISADDPGHSNWLPAPKGAFYTVLRFYLPEEEVIEGSWPAPPLIETLPENGNLIQGSKEAETLVGLDEKDDLIYGWIGNDTIAGKLGDDIIFGEQGDDVLRGDGNSRSPGGSIGGNDTIYGGAGNDRIAGKGGNDTLLGQEGNDKIWGDDGDDLLRGGLGDDILIGGKGSDTFVLASGEGTDIITDFEIGVDLIGLVKGVTFEQLSIFPTDHKGGQTLIAFNDETLAVLERVTETLASSDFVDLA